MFGTSDRRARRTAMKAFKKERRDIFEGLDSEGRDNVVKALQSRLTQLKNRPEADITRQFRNSPFVQERVNEFSKIIDEKRKEMEAKATATMQQYVDQERSRFDTMVKQTEKQQRELNKLKAATRVVANDLITANAEVEAAKKKQETAKANLAKAKAQTKKIKASNKTLTAAAIRKIKERVAAFEKARDIANEEVKNANNEVLRLEREQNRINEEIAYEREELQEYEEELDMREEDVTSETTQLQLRTINQLVFVSKKQTIDVIEQIMTSHPVSVKSPPLFMMNEYKSMMEGYALLCENTADALQMQVTIFQHMKQTGVLMNNGIEVFAFSESAEEYLMNMVDIMQDLTDKANRAATALAAQNTSFNRLKNFFNGIKPNMPPYQPIAFALAVRDHFYTIKQESSEIATLLGVLDPVDDPDRFSKSRIAKFIANAEDVSGTTPDGLIERIEAAKYADQIDSPLLWYRDTNEQYNEILGDMDIDAALGVSPALSTVYESTTPSVGFVGAPSDPSAAARIGADYALPELQRKYDETKAAEMEQRDRIKGIMRTSKDRIKKFKLGEIASEATGSAAELLKKRMKIAGKDKRIKTNPSKRKR